MTGELELDSDDVFAGSSPRRSGSRHLDSVFLRGAVESSRSLSTFLFADTGVEGSEINKDAKLKQNHLPYWPSTS